MDKRIEERALIRPVTRSAGGTARRPSARRASRWSLADERNEREPARDTSRDPADGERGGPRRPSSTCSNRGRVQIRDGAALQAIRRALVYVGKELGEERPLMTRQFQVHGGELLTKFAETGDGALLRRLARRPDTVETLIDNASWTKDIDYEDESARGWRFRCERFRCSWTLAWQPADPSRRRPECGLTRLPAGTGTATPTAKSNATQAPRRRRLSRQFLSRDPRALRRERRWP